MFKASPPAPFARPPQSILPTYSQTVSVSGPSLATYNATLAAQFLQGMKDASTFAFTVRRPAWHPETPAEPVRPQARAAPPSEISHPA